MLLKVGTKFYHKFEITKDIVDQFIQLSKDKNPLHVDKNYSISKGFKKEVVHGNIQNCFLSYFIGELFPIKDVIILSQSIKFKNPTYINQNLLFESTIINFVDSVLVCEMKFEFKTESIIVSTGNLMLKVLK